MGNESEVLAESAEGAAIEIARRFEGEKRDVREGVFVIADPDDRMGLEVALSSMQADTGMSRATAEAEIRQAIVEAIQTKERFYAGGWCPPQTVLGVLDAQATGGAPQNVREWLEKRPLPGFVRIVAFAGGSLTLRTVRYRMLGSA